MKADSIDKMIEDSLNRLPAIERVFTYTKKLVTFAKKNGDFSNIYSLDEIAEINIWEKEVPNIEREVDGMGAVLKVCKRKLRAEISKCNKLLIKELGKQKKILTECRRITEILEKRKPRKAKISSN